MDTDIKRNKYDNIDKKLQVQWPEQKYIALEAHIFRKKRSTAADGIHIQQDMRV